MKSKTKLRSTQRSLPIALLRSRETIMEPLRDMLARSHISEQKWRVLRVIDELAPVEQTTIARMACLLLPSLTRLLRSMESDGLLVRETGAHDRRKSFVTLTDAGRALIKEHSAESIEIFAKLEMQFGKEKLDQLLDLLEELQGVDLN